MANGSTQKFGFKTIGLVSQPRYFVFWKDSDAGKDWGQEEKEATENEMVGWHHPHEFEPTPGDSEEQGSQVCWSP